MKALLQGKEEPVQEFIVLNEYCQVFCGFSKGYPAFSDNMEDARPLRNHQQFKNVEYGSAYKLEKYYV